jgi:triacylglycerol lipase
LDDEVGSRVTSTVIAVPGLDAASIVPLAIHRPKDVSGPLPCIFHIHRGGFVLGSAAEVEAPLRALAAELGCVVTSVDYRLSPEAAFPGPIEDCYAALTWLFRGAAGFGLMRHRIGLMGEGAGGGLAAALALFARDCGEHDIAFQHLNYAMLDDRTCVRDTSDPPGGALVWTRANNRFGWEAMLGQPPGSDGVSQYAAPARAATLAGLPPTYLSTATLDILLDENLDYALRLSRAGVPVELHVWPSAFHAFDLEPTARVAVTARETSKAWLRRMLWS